MDLDHWKSSWQQYKCRHQLNTISEEEILNLIENDLPKVTTYSFSNRVLSYAMVPVFLMFWFQSC